MPGQLPPLFRKLLLIFTYRKQNRKYENSNLKGLGEEMIPLGKFVRISYGSFYNHHPSNPTASGRRSPEWGNVENDPSRIALSNVVAIVAAELLKHSS